LAEKIGQLYRSSGIPFNLGRIMTDNFVSVADVCNK